MKNTFFVLSAHHLFEINIPDLTNSLAIEQAILNSLAVRFPIREFSVSLNV